MTLVVVAITAIVFAFVGFMCGMLWAFSYMDAHEHQMSERIEKGLVCAD